MRLRSLTVVLFLAGCSSGAADDESFALRDVLAGEDPGPGETSELNREFSRRAVRVGSYVALETEPPNDEAWSPVVSVSPGGPKPLSVAAWLASGDITPYGRFDPCRVEPPRALPPLSEADRLAIEARSPGGANLERAACLVGAALRLAPDHTPSFVSAADHALAVYPDERRVEINAALVALIAEPEPASIAQPLEAPPGAPQGTSKGLAPPGPVLKHHEPPPGYRVGDDDDCDCDPDLDCDGKNDKDESCSIARRPPTEPARRSVPNAPLWLLAAAALLAVRREAKSRNPKRRGTGHLTLPLLALLGGALLQPSLAAADTPAPNAHLEAGKKLLAKKDHAGALVELEAARQQGAGPEVLEPLARAYLGVGRVAEAYVTLSELVTWAEREKVPERAQHEKALRELEADVAFVNVQVSPPEAALFVDGRPAPVDPRSRQVVVAPGTRSISATREGFSPLEQTITAERGTRNTVVTLALTLAGARVVVQGFAPDAIIAVDGTPLTQGRWEGVVPEGRHLVQVYRPGSPSYDFPIEARPGETIHLPPPPPRASNGPLPPPAPPPKPAYVGPYVLAHLGVAGLTAKPYGFTYSTVIDEETGEPRERGGAAWYAGISGGYRLSNAIGVGGLFLYTRGGGEGSVTQVERVGQDSYQRHSGPADLLIQSLRLGPNFRFMAGGRVGRFVGSLSFGPVYHFIDLEHVDVAVQGDSLVEIGTYHHDYNGWGPFLGFDLGGEFTIAQSLLVGFALDVLIDRTTRISGDPYEGTAQGYIGLSARIGYADWGLP